MEQVLDYFANIPKEIRTSLLISGIVLFWILEGVLPIIRFQYNKFRHAGINIFLTVCTLIIGLFSATFLLKSTEWTAANNFGLIHYFDAPIWLKSLTAILLLDFIGAYFIHWLEHQVKFLWRFHLVHHTDTTVDVTTGLRHHPGEAVFRICFTILGVVISGASIGMVMLYQTISVFFAHATHANVNTASKMDTLISWIFVTPNMHKVHHHYEQPLTDTNYGNIFSIWDRMFDTFAKVDNTANLIYGVDTHMREEEHKSLWNLLKIPFQKYRSPEGSKFSE